MINHHIDTDKVAQNFAKAHATYAKSAIVQQAMCHHLMKLMATHLPNAHPKRVLEIGCGVGNLTAIYTKRWRLDELYLNDLYDFGTHHQAKRLIGDIESLDLPSVDMVLSGSALQWIKDLPRLLSHIYHALPDSGVLAFSSFGKDNLHQIKTLTGVGLDYHSLDELVAMVRMAGFEIMQACEGRQTLYFDHPKDILRHIKDTGVSVGTQAWTRSSLSAFYEGYDRFATDKGYPLTYDTLFVVAIKR